MFDENPVGVRVWVRGRDGVGVGCIGWDLPGAVLVSSPETSSWYKDK